MQLVDPEVVVFEHILAVLVLEGELLAALTNFFDFLHEFILEALDHLALFKLIAAPALTGRPSFLKLLNLRISFLDPLIQFLMFRIIFLFILNVNSLYLITNQIVQFFLQTVKLFLSILYRLLIGLLQLADDV